MQVMERKWSGLIDQMSNHFALADCLVKTKGNHLTQPAHSHVLSLDTLDVTSLEDSPSQYINSLLTLPNQFLHVDCFCPATMLSSAHSHQLPFPSQYIHSVLSLPFSIVHSYPHKSIVANYYDFVKSSILLY